MKIKLGPNLLTAGLLAISAISSQAQILLFNFNDPSNGTNTISTGSDTATATFKFGGVATNLHGVAGSGLTGQSWDYAFNNTASAGMGSLAGTNGGVAVIPGASSVLSNATSFTLTGWFKSDTVIGSSARLFDAAGSGGYYVQLGAPSTGRLTLSLTTPTLTNGLVTSYENYGATNAWTFFGVTYDASLSRVSFYLGTTNTSVTEITRSTLNAGAMGNLNYDMQIGGAGSIRPYDGFMDNFRVFATNSGSSGALTTAQLETLRYGDITAIPEPSSLLLILSSGIVFYFSKKFLRSRKQS